MHFVDAQEVTAKDLVISVEKLYIELSNIVKLKCPLYELF